MKSALSATALQHYGRGLDAKHFPANWTFTGNALVGVRASVYPEGNEFPASMEDYRGPAGVNAARLGAPTNKVVSGQ